MSFETKIKELSDRHFADFRAPDITGFVDQLFHVAAETGTVAEPAEVVLPPVPTEAASGNGRLPPLQRQWDTTTIDGILTDPVLTSRLDQALTGVDGHVGVVVKDLGSGRGAVLNGNLELQSASLYKLPVLFTVFDSGLNMSEELTISDEAL